MTRERIALVTHLWPVAGAPHAGKPIYETALRLLSHADVRVFCPAPRYPDVRLLQPSNYVYHPVDTSFAPAGIDTEYLEYKTIPWLGRAFNGRWSETALWPALERYAPTLVLSYWLYPTAWAALRCARRLRVPVVVGSRGSDLHRIPDSLARRMTSSTLQDADGVITVTRDLAERAITLGAVRERVTSIPNGCNTDVYHPQDRDEARAALGLDTSSKIVLQVGHIIRTKGVLDLWEAFATLAAKDASLRLAFVGEGPAREELVARATAASLDERLILPGAKPAREVAQWMNAADVVALASHGEGCPNVIVEALACGRPVVGTEVGGVPELIDAHNGALVPAHRPAQLAQALDLALQRTWDTRAIAASSQRSWAQVADETYAACERARAHWMKG